MARSPEPYVISLRLDTNTFQITINPSSGVSRDICRLWRRKSFQNFPAELAQFRDAKYKPTSKGEAPPAAKTAVLALIEHLKKCQNKTAAIRIALEDITVGAWVEKFTQIDISPRTAINNSKNRPPSVGTLDTYKSYFSVHIKDDPIAALKMSELEEDDVTQFANRLALHQKEDGDLIGGTRTQAGVIIFMRMAFKHYQRKFPRWYNPYSALDPPTINYNERDALPEDEALQLFFPGVLKTTMELAVCACMFLSGLRRAEIAALRPEDLDWNERAPRIIVRRAWQCYDKKKRILGPPKGKKSRDAPFDPVLQAAIKKLWEENGQHEWVFSFKKVRGKDVQWTFMNSQWTRYRFPRWLNDAGIELNGRDIVPHSARHSLASLLEERGVSMRHIQDLLGHSDLKTTKKYLHTTEKTIRIIGQKITEAREAHEKAQEKAEEKKIVEFGAS
uniref:Integrase-recombinase n=1 Tax=uncultured bacterium contig00055 TaxID=1181539 RepID=A0A806K148_9BACT|nr:integrase-recombinase [uncultured bacterium contig00055]